ncbi:unnamed protein product [Rhodiola kirilowii]
MKKAEFSRCEADHCCYTKRYKNSYIILLLYVDDMLIAGANWTEIDVLKKKLSKQFAIKDLGAAKQILRMRIIRNKECLKLSQEEHVKKVLKRFNMDDVRPVSTPLASHFQLSKDQSPVTEDEMKHVDKILYASAIGSLMYAMSELGLQGYVNADNGGDIDSRKSISGYIYTYGGTAISWISKLQKIVALSSCEAEYVAVTEAAKEMMWLQYFFTRVESKSQGKCVAL